MSNDELRKYFDIYTECWKLFKKYSDPVNSDEFWRAFTDDANAIYKKNGKSEFCKRLLLDTADEIEKICKGKESVKHGK